MRNSLYVYHLDVTEFKEISFDECFFDLLAGPCYEQLVIMISLHRKTNKRHSIHMAKLMNPMNIL